MDKIYVNKHLIYEHDFFFNIISTVSDLVYREKVEIFSELAKIFSEENNQTNCRELLIKVIIEILFIHIFK